MRLFAPGFGAGAVGGYAVMRVDPAIVAEIEEHRQIDLGGGPNTHSTAEHSNSRGRAGGPADRALGDRPETSWTPP